MDKWSCTGRWTDVQYGQMERWPSTDRWTYGLVWADGLALIDKQMTLHKQMARWPFRADGQMTLHGHVSVLDHMCLTVCPSLTTCLCLTTCLLGIHTGYEQWLQGQHSSLWQRCVEQGAHPYPLCVPQEKVSVALGEVSPGSSCQGIRDTISHAAMFSPG